ncbi:nacht and wd domain protein [Verticillium dahliae]
MTDTIRGVVFLATPHQGRNLADVLRKFLAIVMQTPKQYINELRHNSEALVGINEQYVQHARNMHLASFRETQATSIRSIKSLIVDESSSKLNYPNEICWPLNANHHNVCKFASRQDQNYISVSSVIRDFVKLVTSKAAISISRRPSTVQSFESIRKRLSGLIDTPESCDWILDDLHFRGWLSDDSLEPSILKLSGSPGSGKSVMAGFLVTHLEEIQKNVQYFFFRYNEEAKRSIAVCLKMLAYQIALCMPEYRRKIFPLLEDKNALARNDARGVWQRAFVNLLAKMDLDEPLFWVIDAVDECESAQILLNLLPALKEQSIPVKIIFLTRRQASLRAFERLRYKFGSDFRQTEVVPTREGQKLFIEQELEGAYGEWPQNFVNNVKDDLLRKSKEKQVEEVLSPELTALNIERTVHRLCGDLVVVDEKKGSVSAVHHTAKEFLIHDKGSELAIDPAEAHTLIFVKCLDILMDTQFRVHLKTHGCVGVLKYACIFWATHLACADHLNRQHLRTLVEFFKGECVQAWIEAVGLNGSLSVLTRTSKNLNLFVKRREQYEQEAIPMDRSSEECDFLALWSADLVTGVSNTGWDDLLAKFNTSQTNQPDMICCLDDFFAVLASSNTVNMYSTSTFREIGKIGHGEMILAMKFSEDGDRLATCGKDTVKIWDVESGKRVGHFLNPEGLRAMDVAFDKKCCKVLVCYDDSSVRYMSLLGYNAWQTVPKVLPPASRSTSEPRYATPACASFSPDGTQVAISYRGIMPLRVWHTETGVTDIALSPVGRRIYDLRQTYCHVWEPNSLMRMAEMDDADSDLADSRPGSTSFSLVSEEETVTAILDPIHCLAHSRHGTLYAYSNKVGMLSVVLDADATKIEDQGETIMGVSCIAWSEDGQIATADIGGNIVLRSVTEGRLVTSDLKLKSAEMVRQLLFDHSGRRLLARCITYIAVWSLTNGQCLVSRPLDKSCQWILHPFLHEALLSVTPRELTVHRWEDLESVQQWHIDFQAVESAHHDDVPRLVRSPSSTKALTRLELEASIDKVMFCKEGQWLFVQKSTASPDERRTLDLFTMDVAFLEPGQEGLASPVNSVSATPLPQQILREIEVPLGFVADHVGLKKTLGVPRNLDGASSMAFLGRDFWLCTWYLSADAGNVKIRKHFFLPRDWINMECLELAMITHDGRFLCPRNGELVVVSNGLGGGR